MVRRKAEKRYPSALEALEALKPLLEPSTGTIVFTPEKTAYCNEIVPQFFMGKYPVTQKQWKAVAALEKIKIDLASDPSMFKGDNLPIERVL